VGRGPNNNSIYERRTYDRNGNVVIQRARRNRNGTFTIIGTRAYNSTSDKQWKKAQKQQQKDWKKAQKEQQKDWKKAQKEQQKMNRDNHR
jgi:predicted patatin/cPLA2 family phospholipase